VKRISRIEVMHLALPGALTIYLAFHGGGFFAGEPAQLAVVFSLLLVLRVTLADEPAAGFRWPLFLAAACLSLLSSWALLSALWSGAPARAIVEFDRALAYALVLIFFGSFAARPERRRLALRGVAVGMWVVCGCAFVTRALPDVWPISPNVVNERLSYPLTYWNALGLMATLGLLMALHFACSEREPRAWRVAGAAVAPMLAATLVLTFSRGAIGLFVPAAVVYLVLARPRGALGGVAAFAPAVAIAALGAYGAEALAQDDPTTPAAVDEGSGLALAVVACAVGAGLLRALLLGLDARLERVQITQRTRRRAGLAVLSAVLALGVTGAVALDAAGFLERQYDRFVEGAPTQRDAPTRARLSDPSSNNRLDHWKVAIDTFRAQPLTGTGAGTFGIEWVRERDPDAEPYVEDAHSLYLEVLAELGLPGLLLVSGAVLAVLAATLARLKRRSRHLEAILFATGLTWAVHAGIDWDWEMPAVTLWFFALGGMTLARAAPAHETAPQPAGPAAPRRLTRLVAGVGLLALATTPALVALSQARLNDSVTALKAGNCGEAIDAALGSARALGVRPQPFMLLSLCDARLDRHEVAISTARRAVDLDEENWQTHYTLALALANAGRDPRSAARRTLRLNPYGRLPVDISERFDTDDPKEWRRRARTARLPIL
jgi:O-antigen ligase